MILLASSFNALAQDASTVQPDASIVSIDAPTSIAAGSNLQITISAPVADGSLATLGLSGSFGILVLQAEIRSGVALFALGSDATARSGEVTLTASVRGETTYASLLITPGEAVEPVKPLVGAREIVADGETWAMVVIAPVDQLGNPVANGTIVTLRSQRPDTSMSEEALPVEHLVAWSRITSGTVAGRTTFSAAIGAVPGPQGVLDEVPGWPVSLVVMAAPTEIEADGRSFVNLTTETLIDANGNQVVDGTIVTFIATDDGGREYRIPGQTIGGVAMARFQAPQQAGTLAVVATAYGVSSAPETVAFTAGPAIGAIPLTVRVNDDHTALIVSAGPIVTELGDYVTNGVTATFNVTGMGAVESATAPVSDGHVETSIPIISMTPGEYEVTVAVGEGTGSARITVP